MIPESNLSTVPVSAEETFRARFRRGRGLLLVLAVTAGAYHVAVTLRIYLLGKATGGLSDLLIGWVIFGWVCWCVFRGGKLTGGCFLMAASLFLLALVFGMLAVVGNLVISTGHFSLGIDDFQGIGSDWKSTVSFLPVGAWAAYTFWVLRISQDARLYREARRRGIAEEEANAFEWPPRHRRQG